MTTDNAAQIDENDPNITLIDDKDKNGQVVEAKKNSLIPTGGDGLSKYIAQVNQFPILTKEEEYDYAMRLKENGDKIRRLQPNNKPLLFIRFINDKTVRVHSDGSLAQATINQMGLVNAWHEATNMWGFTTAGFEALAQHQESNVLIFGPLKETKKKQLTQSALWQAMTFSRTDSVYELPAIWTFGGLISAQRFSDNITQQLTQ